MDTATVFDDTKNRMVKSIEAIQRELNTIRTGRASPAIIEHLVIDYYGTPTPLTQIAGISALDPRTLIIQPWDKSTIQSIEKSILTSDLGLNPAVDSNTITIPIPTLTEDRRKDLVRLLKSKAENGKIAIRNIRRDCLEKLKSLEKEKSLSKDELSRSQKNLQTLTDEYIATIDNLASSKENELMQI